MSPTVKIVYGGSFHALSMNSRLFAGGRTRTFITIAEIDSVTNAMKAMTLVGQPKPIRGSSL